LEDDILEWIKELPNGMQNYLSESFGEIKEVQRLSGIKANGGCFRFKFKDRSVIIKWMTNSQEYIFYTRCKPLLKDFSIHIPSLYLSYCNEGSYWIVIEDIPHILPKERWQGDDKVIEALFKLHSETWGKALPLEEYYVPRWNDEMTESVLKLYDDNTATLLEPLLIEVQSQFQQIIRAVCWINGDTNPTNWGIREDGTVVLFDWERISMNNPTIDISITMPGLGTSDNSLEKAIANSYLKHWGENPCFSISQHELIKQIKVVKIWTAVEFLAYNWNTQPKDTIRWIMEELISKLYEFKKFI